jgi:spore germination protein GerM
VDVVVAWVRGDQLIRATRQVSAETRQEQLDAALTALLAGPSTDEQGGGLTTLLPPDLGIDGVVEGRRVVLDLTAASALEPGGVPLAVGQAALTALAVPDVTRVVFAVDGEPTPVPLPDGGSTRVVRAADYRTVTS